MNFRPLHDRVLVERLESEEKSAGGIIIPDTAKEKPMQGKIVSTGAGARDEQGKVHPLDVKAGDTVLFGKWSGTEVKIDGTDYNTEWTTVGVGTPVEYLDFDTVVGSPTWQEGRIFYDKDSRVFQKSVDNTDDLNVFTDPCYFRY